MDFTVEDGGDEVAVANRLHKCRSVGRENVDA